MYTDNEMYTYIFTDNDTYMCVYHTYKILPHTPTYTCIPTHTLINSYAKPLPHKRISPPPYTHTIGCMDKGEWYVGAWSSIYWLPYRNGPISTPIISFLNTGQ